MYLARSKSCMCSSTGGSFAVGFCNATVYYFCFFDLPLLISDGIIDGLGGWLAVGLICAFSAFNSICTSPRIGRCPFVVLHSVCTTILSICQRIELIARIHLLKLY